MATPNLYEQMFQTLLSMEFGRTFWLDENWELYSAPTFKDGSTHWENNGLVSEWTDLEGLNMNALLDIHKTLIVDKTKEELRNATN